ncbi:MAG: YXWGXW repeat-containing protein [Bacteroidales bacterium]|nr:YXWGXW repeat-containing protein [Bacteroidales bacterium]
MKTKKIEMQPLEVKFDKVTYLENLKIELRTRIIKPFAKLIPVAGLTIIGLFFNSCTTGYVATEPAQVEYSRPVRPSELHVWIDGDWKYNRQNHTYIQRNGYWNKPVPSRTWVAGYWQSSHRGQYWIPGHWQRNYR